MAEQVCRSRQGAQPGSQPNLASGNVPHHGHHAQHLGGAGQGQDLHVFCNRCSGTGCAIGHQAVRKGVLYIACFAYCIIIPILFFAVLRNWFYVKPRDSRFVRSPPKPTRGGRSERAAASWVKPRHRPFWIIFSQRSLQACLWSLRTWCRGREMKVLHERLCQQ